MVRDFHGGEICLRGTVWSWGIVCMKLNYSGIPEANIFTIYLFIFFLGGGGVKLPNKLFIPIKAELLEEKNNRFEI